MIILYYNQVKPNAYISINLRLFETVLPELQQLLKNIKFFTDEMDDEVKKSLFERFDNEKSNIRNCFLGFKKGTLNEIDLIKKELKNVDKVKVNSFLG